MTPQQYRHALTKLDSIQSNLTVVLKAPPSLKPVSPTQKQVEGIKTESNKAGYSCQAGESALNPSRNVAGEFKTLQWLLRN